jgi:hypothetical protein
MVRLKKQGPQVDMTQWMRLVNAVHVQIQIRGELRVIKSLKGYLQSSSWKERETKPEVSKVCNELPPMKLS